MMHSGRIAAVLGGPPCETWSRARHLPPNQCLGRPPRPLRSPASLWGLRHLRAREAQQVRLGNRLYRTQLEFMHMCAQYEVPGMLEHPIEPEEDFMASSWRT